LNREPIFRVDLRGFEPHVLGTGKGHKIEVKRSLRNAILQKVGPAGIEKARRRLDGSGLSVTVDFYLWKGAPGVTETRRKKDIDNLLKTVLDVIQSDLDNTTRGKGLGLIDDDNEVWEINARKRLVESEAEEGISITIYRNGET
jgi:Holliday junction resolvase RusA-like endonuclease